AVGAPIRTVPVSAGTDRQNAKSVPVRDRMTQSLPYSSRNRTDRPRHRPSARATTGEWTAVHIRPSGACSNLPPDPSSSEQARAAAGWSPPGGPQRRVTLLDESRPGWSRVSRSDVAGSGVAERRAITAPARTPGTRFGIDTPRIEGGR